MKLRTEIRLGVGLLLAVQGLTSLGAIGVLNRMGPSVERILAENVASTAAAQEMLAALSLSGQQRSAGAEFEEALRRAEQNVTEDAEVPLLAELRARGPEALAGDLAARKAATDAALALARVNGEAMARADLAAQTQARAGAWAAVALGMLSYGLSVWLSRRLRDRLADPLAEIDIALTAARQGEPERRCQVPDAPLEVQRVAHAVNRLLDEAFIPPATCVERDPMLDRAALLHLLDQLPQPTWVLDAAGRVAASNPAALERGLPPADDPGLSRVELGGRGALWVLAG